MKNSYPWLVMLLAVLVPTCLTARVGDTELQCDARYGKPVSNPGARISTESYTRRYKFDGWDIEATFVNRRVVKQSYRRAGQTVNFDEAIPAILQSEAGGGKWQSLVSGTSSDYQDGVIAKARKWRNDNGRTAYVMLLETLVVEEKGYGATTAPATTPKKMPNF